MKKTSIYLFFIAVCMMAFSISSMAMSIDTIIMPPDFDGIDKPFFTCIGKFDKNFDLNSKLVNSPICVNGELLDSVYWLAHPNEPDEYPKRRLPKILGWNYIDDTSSANLYHPNPDTVFYPKHNDSLCWGANQHIMGLGTGRPYSPDCEHLEIAYSDELIKTSASNCDAGPVGCYKILRLWTVYDSCNSNMYIKTQIIKVVDNEGPMLLYADSIKVNMEAHACLGRWEVSPAWLIDNCSNELHYTVEVEHGSILGNETSGYVVVNMPLGMQVAKIIAEDCCGNITEKTVILIVEDNTPPNAICDSKTTISITGNQTPGNNYAKIFAHDLGAGSMENCDSIYTKIIRLDQLKGTPNGSNENQDDGSKCTLINGDDNDLIGGNQIYFDDEATFCCSDVGKTISVVVRVFDRNPGAGPVLPSEMAPGGKLHNRFSDCLTLFEVQDKTVPTLVAPPNIVVSCSFPIDIDKLSDPNDSTFGRVVTDLSYRRKIYTHDIVCHNYCVKNPRIGYPGNEPGSPPSNPPAPNRACDYYMTLFDTNHADRKYDMVWGFDGYSLSACENIPTIEVSENRICGQGRIYRKITTFGSNGVKVTATQTIWIVDCDPFYINRNDPCDPNDDIIWPNHCNGQAILINDCSTDTSPDNPLLGKPEVVLSAIDHCTTVNVEYTDLILNTTTDTCFRILRTWTVTDDCQYDPSYDPNLGKWTYTQEINVLKVVGTEENQKITNEFIIMPNPSRGNVFIQSTKKIDQIQLISCLGKTQLRFEIRNQHSIELNNISSGVYFVQAYFKGVQVASGKLVVME